MKTTKLKTGNIQNYRKMGNLGVNFGGDVGFWVKNKDWGFGL
jgi:hypothetical protein